jgi:hypothetical protein
MAVKAGVFVGVCLSIIAVGWETGVPTPGSFTRPQPTANSSIKPDHKKLGVFFRIIF